MAELHSNKALIRRGDRAVYRRLAPGEGGVLLHLDTAAYHGINEFGTLIWERLETPRTLQSLVAELESVLADTPPGWGDDVRAFVEDLAERDLVSLSDGDTAAPERRS